MPRLAVFPKGFFDRLVRREMTVFEWLSLAATLDVDGVELHPAFLDRVDSRYLSRVRHAADAEHLAIPMLCHSPDFAEPDPGRRRVEIERTIAMFRVTSELGGRFCRVLSGQNHPGLVAAETTRSIIEILSDLIPHAERTGITMCLENHYKDGLWTYPEFAQHRDRYLTILDAVDSPRLAVQFDPSNAIVAGDDPYDLLARVLPRVATVHASDRYLEAGTIEDLARLDRDPHHGYAPLLTHGVVGRGLNDYERIFGTLSAGGFNGWISIEDGDGPTVETGMANLREIARLLLAAIDRHWAPAGA